MTFLLKLPGDPDKTYTQLMTDFKSIELSQWSIRPIAVGNAHDRTIGRARLRLARTPIKIYFQSEEVGQHAFGPDQDIHPDDVLASEDGSNALGMLAKKQCYFCKVLLKPYE